jgi:hypothetical protein
MAAETRMAEEVFPSNGVDCPTSLHTQKCQKIRQLPRFTKSDTGGELVEGLGYRDFMLSFPTQNIDFVNSPPVSKVGKNPFNSQNDNQTIDPGIGLTSRAIGRAARVRK